MEFIYECKDCHWSGMEEELENDSVESCLGEDSIEVCPKCGSMNLVRKVKN